MRFFDFFYIWIPFVVLGAIVVLALPWLAVIALMAALVAAVAALSSLVWAVVAGVSGLGHSASGHPRELTAASQRHPDISSTSNTLGTVREDVR